jgi:hypothetical protein
MYNSVELVITPVVIYGYEDVKQLKNAIANVIKRKNSEGERLISITPVPLEDGHNTTAYIMVFEGED